MHSVAGGRLASISIMHWRCSWRQSKPHALRRWCTQPPPPCRLTRRGVGLGGRHTMLVCHRCAGARVGRVSHPLQTQCDQAAAGLWRAGAEHLHRRFRSSGHLEPCMAPGDRVQVCQHSTHTLAAVGEVKGHSGFKSPNTSGGAFFSATASKKVTHSGKHVLWTQQGYEPLQHKRP